MDLIDVAKQTIDSIMAKHQNVALFTSGGKDSLTIMHLAREHAQELTLVHNSMGDDGFPGELENLIEQAHAWGYFHLEIVKPALTFDQYVDRFGWPSHLLHDDMDGGFPSPWIGEHRVSGTWHCSMWRVIAPLVECANTRGFDAILTATRGSDGPAFERMGAVADRSDVLGWVRYNPIIEWTPAEVYAYVDDHGITLPPVYDEVKRHADFEVPDCRLCPFSDGYVRWLKEHRPMDFSSIKSRYGPIWRELKRKASETLDGMRVLEGE